MLDYGANQESSSGEPKEHQKAPSDHRPPSLLAGAEGWQEDTQSTQGPPQSHSPALAPTALSQDSSQGALHCFLVLP